MTRGLRKSKELYSRHLNNMLRDLFEFIADKEPFSSRNWKFGYRYSRRWSGNDFWRQQLYYQREQLAIEFEQMYHTKSVRITPLIIFATRMVPKSLIAYFKCLHMESDLRYRKQLFYSTTIQIFSQVCRRCLNFCERVKVYRRYCTVLRWTDEDGDVPMHSEHEIGKKLTCFTDFLKLASCAKMLEKINEIMTHYAIG